MTNFNFSKARNHPLNRDGETITVQASEGDLVGLTENANGETELVAADADAAVQQPAIGVLLEEVQDPADIKVSGFEDAYIEQRQLRREVREEDYTLVGDEGTYVFTGVYLEDVDGDLDLNPNEPVYLAAGGGITQTKPTGSGAIVQKIGVAVDATTYLLTVEQEYAVVEESNTGDVSLDGDSTNGKVTFSVPHGLSVTPSDYRVEATSADADGNFHVSNVDATNIDVTYETAPPDGTGNVGLHFYAHE